MTEAAIEEVRQELKGLRELMLVLVKKDDRMVSRQELAERMGITTRTLAKRIESGQVPPPVHGKWLLSEVLEFMRH